MLRNFKTDQVLLLIACAVTILWGITVLVESFFPEHKMPDSVNQIMLIVAGALFGSSALTNLHKGDSDKESGKDGS